MINIEEKLKNLIRDVPDFPKKGILFKDITPVLSNPEFCKELASQMVAPFLNDKIDVIAGIESRGFLFGPLMAQILNVPFVLIRKQGKLPWKTISQDYDLEYGKSIIEVHIDSIKPNQNVLIHDDLLATGGTAEAAAQIVQKMQANVSGFSFLVKLSFLNGEEKLNHYSSRIANIAVF
jgi:adenine phosphoribosyltransferase